MARNRLPARPRSSPAGSPRARKNGPGSSARPVPKSTDPRRGPSPAPGTTPGRRERPTIMHTMEQRMDAVTQSALSSWTPLPGYRDIIYAKADEGIAKITINRPEVRNAFRPETVHEMQSAFADARDDPNLGVV